MNKFEQKRNERNQIILREAKKLILERGITDGIMSELATRAGISRQRLYVYYSNIDEVLRAIMETVYEQSHLTDIRDSVCTDPKSVIRYSILSFPKLSDDVRDNLLLLSLFSVYAATNNKSIMADKPRIRLYEKQIAEGRAQGIFRTDVDEKTLCGVVTHLIVSFLTHSETLGSNERRMMFDKEVLNLLADMVINYLCVK